MPDAVGSLIGRAAAAACLLPILASSALAQQPHPAPSEQPPASPQFLAHYNMHFAAAALSIDDPRFSWDTRWGGDFDLADYVVGRLNVLADYEAVLGDELRKFDPNQGNYTLEFSLSARTGPAEFAAVFHHVSRHLSDRAKKIPIAWNVLGVRALRRIEAARTTFDIQGSAGRVTEHASVDYVWTADLDVVIRRPVTPHFTVFVHGLGELFGIDSQMSSRGAQKDGRVEAGIRLLGGAAALELFAGFERRIDADPIDRQAQRWTLVGFRLVNQ